MNLKVNLSVEDYTIILNALHYYKKAEKRDNFKQYTPERINALRDSLADQFMVGFNCFTSRFICLCLTLLRYK